MKIFMPLIAGLLLAATATTANFIDEPTTEAAPVDPLDPNVMAPKLYEVMGRIDQQILGGAEEMMGRVVAGEVPLPFGSSALKAELTDISRRRRRQRELQKGSHPNAHAAFKDLPTDEHRHLKGSSSKGCKTSGSKSKSACKEEAFKLFIAVSVPLESPLTSWEGDEFVDAEDGQSAALEGFMVGLELTFAEDVAPIDLLDESTWGRFFEDLFESLSEINIMFGTLTGTLSKINSFSAYTHAGLDYLTFRLGYDFEEDFPCEPIIRLNQLRSSGAIVKTPFGDPGILPITGTSFNLARHVDGGNMLLYTNDDSDIPAIMVGFIPFTEDSACNQNNQIESIIVNIQEIVDFLVFGGPNPFPDL